MRVRRADGGERRAQVTLVYENVHLCMASDTSVLLCTRFMPCRQICTNEEFGLREIFSGQHGVVS